MKESIDEANHNLYNLALGVLELPEDCTDKQLISNKRKRLSTYNPESTNTHPAMKEEYTKRFISILAAYEIAHKYRLEKGIGEEAHQIK